jgi:preprotein translocase subunit YajC
MDAPVQLLVIVAAMVLFWAIVMRPARQQQKRVQQLQRDLEVGTEVVLSSGIFGTIRALTQGRAEVEVAPGTVITVARQVVVRRVEEFEDSPQQPQDAPRDPDSPPTQD